MKRWTLLVLALVVSVLAGVVLSWRASGTQAELVVDEAPLQQTAHQDAVAYASAAADEAVSGVAVVELDWLRDELPDNLYWREAAPTDDSALLERRAVDKERRNALYGKILSGGATDDDIEQYYAYRERVSRDYIVISQRVLARYGEALSEQERGLYELSINMHGMRLQELPRAKTEAYARKAQQEEARALYARP